MLISVTILLNTYVLLTNVVVFSLAVLMCWLMVDEVTQAFYLLANLNGEFLTNPTELVVMEEEIFLDKDEIRKKIAN